MENDDNRIDPFMEAFLATTRQPVEARQTVTDADMADFYEELRIEKLTVTVGQLASALAAMPQDAEVCFLVESCYTIAASAVWLSRYGEVLIARAGDDVQNDYDKPEGVPPNWKPPPLADHG